VVLVLAGRDLIISDLSFQWFDWYFRDKYAVVSQPWVLDSMEAVTLWSVSQCCYGNSNKASS